MSDKKMEPSEQSELKDVMRLVRNSLLCATPLLIFYGVPAWLLYLGGETADVDTVAMRQSKSPGLLYGTAYGDQTELYKLHVTRRYHPRILALGTSRVMQFRREMFLPETRFYNAGGAAATAAGLRYFLEQLSADERPEILIVGLDQNFFNEHWRHLAGRTTEQLRHWEAGRYDAIVPIGLIGNAARDVWSDLLAGKLPMPTLVDERAEHLGINARMRGNGFRADGSRDYGAADGTGYANRFAITLERINAGSDRFVPCTEVRQTTITEINRLLQLCQAWQIEVIGFLPPWAPSVVDELRQRGDDYAYLKKIEAAIRPMFRTAGFRFYDFSDVREIGGVDAEFVDGFHGSDRVYARMLNRMASDRGPLSAVVHRPLLAERLSSQSDRF